MAQKKKTAKDSPGKQALASLHRISIKVSNEVYSPLLSQLTVSQFGILETIYQKGPMNQKELAQHIQKTTGNLTTVIDNLEKKGLVLRERGENDRRCNKIILTPEGSSFIKKLFPSYKKHAEKVMGRLSKAEQERLLKICEKLVGKEKLL